MLSKEISKGLRSSLQVNIDNIISFNEKFEFLVLFVLENVIGLPIDSKWAFF